MTWKPCLYILSFMLLLDSLIAELFDVAPSFNCIHATCSIKLVHSPTFSLVSSLPDKLQNCLVRLFHQPHSLSLFLSKVGWGFHDEMPLLSLTLLAYQIWRLRRDATSLWLPEGENSVSSKKVIKNLPKCKCICKLKATKCNNNASKIR